MKKTLIATALLAVAASLSGCVGLSKTIDSLAKDTNTVRIQISNPVYGYIIIERNIKSQPLILQSTGLFPAATNQVITLP